MMFKRILAGAAVALLAGAAMPASAAVITSNGYSVGIGDNGELYDAAAGVGFARADDYDPIAPGAPRDSWGLNGVYADGQFFGSTVATTNIVAGPDGAVAITDTGIGFTVKQTYSFAGVGNILKIDTLVTNETGDAVSATFQRTVDWDIFPTFSENVFGGIGSTSGIIDASYYGFESPDTNTPYAFSCNSCNETGDLGGGIKINLGTLNAGASRLFTYYYGVNRDGSDVNALIGDAQSAGARFVIAAQGDGDTTNSVIIGVSGAVPEPATWAMMLAGFFGLGSVVRRRRVAAIG